MNERSDVTIFWNESGWMDTPACKKFIDVSFGRNRLFNQKAVLVWDSYKVHISKEIKDYYQKRGISGVVIPAGCTGILQVCFDKLFIENL